jgi:hypothetical protein
VIDKPCRGPNASWRATGLDQDWGPLGRRHDAERPLDLEEPAEMVDWSHFGRVGDEAVQSVSDESVGNDAGPQRFADRDEFFHAIVALAIVDQLVKPVILVIRAPAAAPLGVPRSAHPVGSGNQPPSFSVGCCLLSRNRKSPGTSKSVATAMARKQSA